MFRSDRLYVSINQPPNQRFAPSPTFFDKKDISTDINGTGQYSLLYLHIPLFEEKRINPDITFIN